MTKSSKTWIQTGMFIFLVVLLNLTFGQKEILIYIVSDSTCPISVHKEIQQKRFISEEQAIQGLNKQLFTLFEDGYLMAGYDSIRKSDTLISVRLHCGKQFYSGHFTIENFDCSEINKTSFSHISSYKKPFRFEEIQLRFKKIVSFYENNGYPFVSLRLQNIHLVNDTIYANLECNKGPYITIDSIKNIGNLFINTSVFSSIAGINSGNEYSEKSIKEIENKLKYYPFLKQKSPAQVIFKGNQATVISNYDKKKAGTFDGILGLMPDYQNKNKLFVTGDIAFELWNSLNFGEQFQVKWKQPERLSQDLKLKMFAPAIVLLPLGASYELLLNKKDTTYINADNIFSMHYRVNAKTDITGYSEYFSSSLLSIGQYKNSTSLPPHLDMKITSVGLALKYNYNEQILNPDKGFFAMADMSLGEKKIRKNTGIAEILYDKVYLKTYRVKAKTVFGVFVPVTRQSLILLKNNNGIIKSQQLFSNELFILGGIRDIRGFDENFFLSSLFTIQTVEYRFFFEENSWFSLFSDFGYIELKSMKVSKINRPLSFGTGITFETPAGLFTLSYAIGKTQDYPFQMKTGKIHFGLVSAF